MNPWIPISILCRRYMPEKGSSTSNHSIVYVHIYKFVVEKRKRGTAEVVTVPTCDNMIIFHTRKPSQKHNNWGLILLLQYQPLRTQCSRQQKQFFWCLKFPVCSARRTAIFNVAVHSIPRGFPTNRQTF